MSPTVFWGEAVRMSDCSPWAAYPTVRRCPTHVFCGTLCNFFFFFVSAHHERFFLWVHQLSLGISPLAARKNAWDLSGGRWGYRLGFIRGLLGISLGIYLVVAQEIAWDFSSGRPGDPQAYSV